MKYDKYVVEIDTKGVLWNGEVVYPLKGLSSYLTAEQLLKLTPLADQCHECCSMERKTKEIKTASNELDKSQTITDKDKNCLTCEFSGRPTYKSPCSECNAHSQWKKKMPKSCEMCKSLESGNMLYQLSDWDGGIGFKYIHDIRFCPVCGREIQ